MSGEMRIEVFQNGAFNDGWQQRAVDAIRSACSQINNQEGITYDVTKREDHTFSIDNSQSKNNILDDFDWQLYNNNLYDADYPRAYVLVYDNDSGSEGQARYQVGDDFFDNNNGTSRSRSTHRSIANRYGLAVVDMEDTKRGDNVAIQETLHLYMDDKGNEEDVYSDHSQGVTYQVTGETSPMATGYQDEGWFSSNCKTDGSHIEFVDTLTGCTKNEIGRYLNSNDFKVA